MSTKYILECWIEHPVQKLDQTFTYLSNEEAEPGERVLIDFNGRQLVGFVESVVLTTKDDETLENEYGYSLKYIKARLDQQPLLTEELQDLANWMRDYTLSTHIACYQAMLPSKIKPITSKHQIVMERWVTCSDQVVSLTPKQLQAYEYVRTNGQVRYSDLRKQFPNAARALIEKGALLEMQKEKEAKTSDVSHSYDPFPLSDQQNKAIHEIESSSDDVYLLHGVTGSGKTEIYLRLASKALLAGKQVLLLVPEIGLTPQMIKRVQGRFGMDLAIYHSGLSAQEKYEQYRKVKQGKVSIVVGTRSAVFLPFQDLGLIVVDEEHDPSYKQETQPSYHCRDIAIWRGKYHHCKVILGSATPSLESYARGMKNVYHLIEMPNRINESLPEIELVSLRDSMRKGESYILTDRLKESIQETLDRHEQVILLLNRRGYSSQLRCRSCKTTILCPHCDLAMSYHRDERVMKCHSCGTVMRVPQVCPHCGSRDGYASFGFGTQRLEEEVQALYPKARLIRMDADTTQRKNSHQKLLAQFADQEADILLGTQMISKGLDFANVTLVGILNGDAGADRADYRSCEQTFDLLMQTSGRSGRSEKKGRVIMQVFDPDHYAVQCALRQDYLGFFQREMKFRHAGQYPPYTYMISLTVYSKDEQKADRQALELMNELRGNYKTIGVIALLKRQDRYRRRILVKGKDQDEMKRDIRLAWEKMNHQVDVRIDVNPINLEE